MKFFLWDAVRSYNKFLWDAVSDGQDFKHFSKHILQVTNFNTCVIERANNKRERCIVG